MAAVRLLVKKSSKSCLALCGNVGSKVAGMVRKISCMVTARTDRLNKLTINKIKPFIFMTV